MQGLLWKSELFK